MKTVINLNVIELCCEKHLHYVKVKAHFSTGTSENTKNYLLIHSRYSNFFQKKNVLKLGV